MRVEEESYFRRLVPCLALSLGLQGLVFAWSVQDPRPGLLQPSLLVLGGLGPLVWYHFGILARMVRKGATGATVDSVYYYGFLVTLGALAFGALGTSLTAQNDLRVEQVVAQFALGLIATGYAIVARLHLTSLEKAIPGQHPEETLDTYVNRSRALIRNLEEASGALANLSRESVEQTDSIVRTSQHALTTQLQAVTTAFTEELRESFAQVLRSGNEVSGVMNELAIHTQRRTLGAGIERTLEHLDALATALNRLTEETGKGATSAQAFAIASEELTGQLRATENGLRVLGAAEGPLAGAASQIQSSGTQIAQGCAHIGSAMASLSEVAEMTSQVGVTVRALKKLVDRADRSLEAFADTVSKLETDAANANTSVANASRLSTGLAEEVRTLAASVAVLATGFEGVATRLSGVEGGLERTSAALNGTLERAGQALDHNVSRAGDAATLFTERLTVVAQRVVDGVNGGRGK
jgi:hypothetical protein